MLLVKIKTVIPKSASQIKNYLLKSEAVVEGSELDEYVDFLTDHQTQINSGITNVHHIVPRSHQRNSGEAEDNSKDNLVILTYEDHIRAHYYLYCCCVPSLKDQMRYTFLAMTDFSCEMVPEALVSLERYSQLRQEWQEWRNSPEYKKWHAESVRSLGWTPIEDAMQALPKEKLRDLYIKQNMRYVDIMHQYNLNNRSLTYLLNLYGFKEEDKLKYFTSKISKQDLYQYYVVENHSREDVMQYFEVNRRMLRLLLLNYDIHKAVRTKGKISAEELSLTVSREDFYKQFIELNQSVDEVATHFGIKRHQVALLGRYYGIQKSAKQANQRRIKQLDEQKLRELYSDITLSKRIIAKYFHTCDQVVDANLIRYGLPLRRVQEKRIPTKDELYQLYAVQKQTRDQILAQYDISREELRKMISDCGIIRCEQKSVPEKDFYDFYITQNHNWKETKEHFGFNEGDMRRAIKQGQIVKKDILKAQKAMQKNLSAT